MIKISILPLTCIAKNSNLFLIEFIFKWAKISLFTLSLRIVFSVMLHSSYFLAVRSSLKLRSTTLARHKFVSGKLFHLQSYYLKSGSHLRFKAGLYDGIFLSRPWNFYFERKGSKYFSKRNVCREILFSLFTQTSFIHTIMITIHS